MVKGPGNRLPGPSTMNDQPSTLLTTKERSGSRVEPSRSYKSPKASGIRIAKKRRAKGEADGDRKVEVRSSPSPKLSRAMSARAVGAGIRSLAPSPFALRIGQATTGDGRMPWGQKPM